MTIDLGSDFEAPGALLPDMRLLTSDNDKALGYLYACARRLTMQNGSLWFDLDAGLDMRDYVNDTETPAVAQQAINGELLKDERTAQCDTVISIQPGGAWRVSINAQTKDGSTYQLVFLVTAEKANLLQASVT